MTSHLSHEQLFAVKTHVEDQDRVLLAQSYNEPLVSFFATVLGQDAQHCLTSTGRRDRKDQGEIR